MKRPAKYEEISYVNDTAYYKLIVKRGFLGRYVIKVFLSGDNKNQLSCVFRLITWSEFTFKRWLAGIVLKKYNVFYEKWPFLCDLFEI